MKVLEYLEDHMLSQLTEEYGIRVKDYPALEVFTLNYNQIDHGTLGHKSHPIIMECRGLIISYNYHVVSRSFDRFFNIGEVPDITGKFDISGAEGFEKLDGSLINIYYWKDKWHIATRGTADASGENYSGRTFRELVLEAFGCPDMETFTNALEYQRLSKTHTHIFELIHPDNRIVTKYAVPQMVLLGMRNLVSGEIHISPPATILMKFEGLYQTAGLALAPRFPEHKTFTTMEDLTAYVEGLSGLQEGLVLYDYNSGVRVKIKNSVYLAVHRLRGESVINGNRIRDLVVTGETGEFLLYFPEYVKDVAPYIQAYEEMLENFIIIYESYKDIEDQKEFALAVKGYGFSWVLFKARSMDTNPVRIFTEARQTLRNKTLEGFMSSDD